MKRALLHVALLATLALGAAHAARERRAAGEQPAAAYATSQAAALAPATSTRRHPRTGTKPDITVTEAALAGALSGDSEETRTRIRRGEQGTYIGEVLLGRDSALTRWRERVEDPLRVWVADGAAIADWHAEFKGQVRDAFDQWARLGIPVRFTFVVDSADADIRVAWTDHFDEAISGKTLWSRDRRWWIVGGNITLALHHNKGEALDGASIRAIALHEVGHLLGLDHTSDTSNIMTARVRVRELSDADRATIRLLYSLPAGSIK
ncbi:MAG: matrixin family metalloprotease [Gemmatimonadaceae bacterium]